jgi:hypothetical protein
MSNSYTLTVVASLDIWFQAPYEAYYLLPKDITTLTECAPLSLEVADKHLC